MFKRFRLCRKMKLSQLQTAITLEVGLAGTVTPNDK